jgi:hypothetical protein
MKRTKNQGFGIVVKAQFSVFIEDFRFERFILSVICCAATCKI